MTQPDFVDPDEFEDYDDIDSGTVTLPDTYDETQVTEDEATDE